jgi:hypothetical protein
MDETSAENKKTVRVFFASPGDLPDEREAFLDTCRAFDTAHKDLRLIPLMWETLNASAGVRVQTRINELVDKADVVVLAMHRRWGQETLDASPQTSHTEEELQRAVKRLAQTGAPEIFCFFKQLDPAALADPGPQLRKVLDLKQTLEQSNHVLYRTFVTPDDFVRELETHLIGFVTASLPTPRNTPRHIHLPVLTDWRPNADEEFSISGLMKQAISAAQLGRLEDAASLFARIAQQTTDVKVLDLAQHFFEVRDERATAARILDKRLAITRDRVEAARLYAAVMGATWVDELVRSASSQVPEEERDLFAAVMREIFESPEWNERMVADLAEHFTVWELRILERFYGREGRSIMTKFGRFMGDVVPQAVEFVTSALRRRGFNA